MKHVEKLYLVKTAIEGIKAGLKPKSESDKYMVTKMKHTEQCGLVKLAFGAGIQAGLKATKATARRNLKDSLETFRMNPKSNIFMNTGDKLGEFSGRSTFAKGHDPLDVHRTKNLYPDEEGIAYMKNLKDTQRMRAGGGGAADEQFIMAMNPNYHMVGGLAKVNPAYKGPWGREGMHNPQIKELLPKLFRRNRELFEPQIM